jgi:hypothetical protein
MPNADFGANCTSISSRATGQFRIYCHCASVVPSEGSGVGDSGLKHSNKRQLPASQNFPRLPAAGLLVAGAEALAKKPCTIPNRSSASAVFQLPGPLPAPWARAARGPWAAVACRFVADSSPTQARTLQDEFKFGRHALHQPPCHAFQVHMACAWGNEQAGFLR